MHTQIYSLPASLRPSVTRAVAGLLFAIILLQFLPERAFAVSSWKPTLLVDTEAFQQIDNGDGASNVELQFGSSTSTLVLLTTGTFRFNKSLSVNGMLSGSLLTIDGQANFSGAVIAKRTITARSTISGANLTFMGVTSSYILGSIGIGTATPKAKLDVIGTVSGANLTVSGNGSFTGSLRVVGNGLFDGGTLFVDSTNDKVAVGRTSGAKARLDVVGTISGANLVVSNVSSFSGAITALRTLTVKGAFSGSSLIVSGTSSFSGSAVFRTNLAVKNTFSGSTFYGAGLGDCSNATTSKLLYNPSTGKFTCGSDQTSTSIAAPFIAVGDPRYVNAAGDTMTGTLTVDVTSEDVVKTTTGTANATDFSYTGYSLLNVTSTNDTLSQDLGTVPSSGQGTFSTSTVYTTRAVGTGAMTIIRDDGKFIVISGNEKTGSQGASLWDGIAGTMTAVSSTFWPGASASVFVHAGAIALKRPDGKYMVIPGGAANNVSLFDPWAVTATVGSTSITCSPSTGTNAFMLGSGSYIITCGTTAGKWMAYNPVVATANAFVTNTTAVGMNFKYGSINIQRDDGSFLVFGGGNTSDHMVFNNGMPLNQSWSTLNPISSAPTISFGAFALRRPDGRYLIVGGAQDSSTIYDPRPTTTSRYGTFTAQSGVGKGPTVALRDGATAIWRPDGKFLLLIGSGSTTTNIIDPSREDGGQFVAGPTMPVTPGVGMHAFYDGRGKVRIIRGGGTGTLVYDSGFIRGGSDTGTGAIYTTECITAALQSGSYLTWKTNADDALMRFQVRTSKDSCTGNYKYIKNRGDLINPVSGDNRVQIKVIFERDIPRFAMQEWGIRRAGQTQYRRLFNDPVLYDITVHNTSSLHRTQFEFGNSSDSTGPLAVNVVNDRSKNLQIQLANMVAYPSTANTVNAKFYNGAFATGSSLPAAASIGTIVLKRPDSKFVIILGKAAGGASSNVYIYDPVKMTYMANGTTTGAATSTGALAFKRADGKFFIVMGGNTTVTNIYDPVANTFTQGPVMRGRVQEGSQPIPLPNGRVLILHGGFKRTSTLYDGITNTVLSGAVSLKTIGRGSIVIPKPDGKYLVIPGTTNKSCTLQTATMIFDPYANWFLPNPNVVMTNGTGPGAYAFERSDGQWVIVKGGATVTTCAPLNSTNIYNPSTNRLLVGPVIPNTASVLGGQAMQRPDGSWLLTFGGGTGATALYYEKSGAWTTEGFPGSVGTFINGPLRDPRSGTGGTRSFVGSGSVAFQRDDGKYLIIAGDANGKNGNTNTSIYDAGWVAEGFYRSEAVRITDMDSNSTLSWSGVSAPGGISAQVRTGTSALMLGVGTEREVPVSGGKINPTTGDTFAQVQFSFRRTFPSYPGIYEDVWWNGGSTLAFRYRTFDTPTISEFSIAKDKDLVNLRSDKLSIFRVSSNGDVYTGTKGALFSGGADLAEHYKSTQNLNPGDLVMFDYLDDHSVLKSTKPYQTELLGVVSTNPGFVAGGYTEQSFPIALVGRVPVNVTLENGPINAGDRITSGTIPGFGMKATKKGRVVGLALDSTNKSDFKPCAANPDLLCGQIMMFVNLRDWPGPKK